MRNNVSSNDLVSGLVEKDSYVTRQGTSHIRGQYGYFDLLEANTHSTKTVISDLGDFTEINGDMINAEEIIANSGSLSNMNDGTFKVVNVSETLKLLPGAVVDGIVIPMLPPAIESIANLSTTADNMIYTTSGDTYATTSLTPYSRSLLASSTEVHARAVLGTVIGSDVQAYTPSLQSLSGVASAGNLLGYTTGPRTATDIFRQSEL